MRTGAAALLTVLLAALLVGCGSSGHGHYCTTSAASGCTRIPTGATKAAFCQAGAVFSDSEGFSNGRKAARALAAVGTPADIKASARAGFVELVERMADARNGPDFRSRTRSLAKSEKQHLLDLDAYIHATC